MCEEYGLSFILGQAPNCKLHELGAPLMEQALAQAEEHAEEEPVRLFTSFDYQAKSWKRPQRILYKAEVTQGKANPRFVTTNIPDRTPKFDAKPGFDRHTSTRGTGHLNIESILLNLAIL